jgi:hypothetical protein
MRALPSASSLAEAHRNMRSVFASIGIWRVFRSGLADLRIDQSDSIRNAVEKLRHSLPTSNLRIARRLKDNRNGPTPTRRTHEERTLAVIIVVCSAKHGSQRDDNQCLSSDIRGQL